MPIKTFLEHGALTYRILTVIQELYQATLFSNSDTRLHVNTIMCVGIFYPNMFSNLIFFTSTNETFLEKKQ